MFWGCLGGIRPKHWILTKKSMCPPPVWVVGRGPVGRCLGGWGGGLGRLELQCRRCL